MLSRNSFVLIVSRTFVASTPESASGHCNKHNVRKPWDKPSQNACFPPPPSTTARHALGSPEFNCVEVQLVSLCGHQPQHKSPHRTTCQIFRCGWVGKAREGFAFPPTLHLWHLFTMSIRPLWSSKTSLHKTHGLSPPPSKERAFCLEVKSLLAFARALTSNINHLTRFAAALDLLYTFLALPLV